MAIPKKALYLIDASSYMYRAFYALGRLTGPDGKPTQAIYGFAQMLLKVLREKKPELICVVFDAPGPNFRHELYASYKATRQKMPEDLAEQVPLIKKLVALHGLPQAELEGFEADDIIATLAGRASKEDIPVVIVSADKDLHQLVADGRILQWDPQKDEIFTEKEVAARLGVKPSQVADLLALMGDSSDNVPGVPGVGEKTARNLLARFPTLEAVYEHLDDVTSAAVRKKLENHRDLAFLSRDLVTIRDDVPLNLAPSDCRPGEPRYRDLLRFYEGLGFRSLVKSLREDLESMGREVPLRKDASERTVAVVRDLSELERVVREIQGRELFSLDLETTSQDAMRAEIVGIALSWEDHRAVYIPVGHRGEGSEGQLDASLVLKTLAPLLTQDRPGKAGQNIKYEWVVLQRAGVDLRGIAFDTMVASYLLDPGHPSHKLERIAAEYLGESIPSYADVAGKGKSQVNFSQVPVEKAAAYACSDAETTWRLVSVLKAKLEEEKLKELFVSLEMPLVRVLGAMELRGIRVDARGLEDLSRDLETKLEAEARVIYDMAGREFNIQSPKQLAEVLFDKLCLRVVKRTKTGPSTDVEVLEELAAEHPIAEHVLTYRTLAKLKGTYVDALPKLIHPETGRIHTSYNQAVTATGRLSSSDPNLQNIPVRGEEGRRIREAFVAEPGHVLMAADYSQIELRLLAHYSGDEHLVAAFRDGADIHRRTAAEIFGVPYHEVTSEMRRHAKTINFGIIYGMSPYGLARQLRIGTTAAKAAIDRYFERYSGVKAFIERTIEHTRKLGYAETLLGRRRKIPELQSRNRTVRQQGERLAVNTPLQGTAADLIKKAMIDIDRVLAEEGLKTAMLLQVHDELVFEVPEEEIETVRKLVQEKMEKVITLKVPLTVDLGWGPDWSRAHG